MLFPLWLQQFMGYTSTQAGMMLAPVGLFAILLSPIVGKNVQKFDPRKLATFSFVMFSLVLWMRSQFNTQADFMTIMLPTIIQGIAVAFFFIPLSTLTLNGIAPANMPSASGLSNFMRILGGSFGTSVTITLWQDRTAMHHAELSELINRSSQATNSAIGNFAAAGMSQEQGLASINRLIDQQAATMAADDIFLASAFIFLLLIPIIWLAKPMQPPPQGVPSAKAPADAAGAH